MHKKLQLLAALILVSFSSIAQTKIPVSKNLEIIPLTKHSLLYKSYMQDSTWGRVDCNGVIYISGKEAIILNTPYNNKLSKKLLDWFAVTYPGVTIKGVIVNHFHADGIGGLDEFHKRGIKSYGNKMTAELAAQNGKTVPYNTFTGELKMKVGGERILCRYFGEAHTKDGIITWIPAEHVLFGGCTIKAKGAGKGNIADANLMEWPATAKKINAEFGSQTPIVVPGHGAYGGAELLSYTLDLFDGE
jgi:metallo-beta-lactamase class B